MKSSKIIRYVLYITYILSPLILILLLSFICNCNAFIGHPIWSDEFGYWKEVFSFTNHDFNTGYMGFNELTPKIGRFSTHGFFPAFFYYPFAKILGWPANGIVISNLIFTVICFTLVTILYKPNISQTIKMTFLYLFFPPIILYAATSMTEILHYGFLVLFFLFFYKYCNSKTKNKKYFLFLTILIGTISSLYRITYILLFLIPVFILSDLKLKKFIKLFLYWVLYSGFLYYITSIFIAPYPFWITYKISHAPSLNSAIEILISNFKSNIKNWINITNGAKIEVYFRFFYLLLLTLYFLLIFFRTSFKKSKKDFISISLREKFSCFYIAQFILLFVPFIIILMIYDVFAYRDLRALAPFWWISFFNLIIYKKTLTLKFFKLIFITFFIISTFNTSSWIQSFQISNTGRFADTQKRDFTLIQNVVQYKIDVKDPFENTIATDVEFDFELCSNLHPGIGIEWLPSDFNLENCKSKYLLINKNQNINGYERKGKTEFGYLYEKEKVN